MQISLLGVGLQVWDRRVPQLQAERSLEHPSQRHRDRTNKGRFINFQSFQPMPLHPPDLAKPPSRASPTNGGPKPILLMRFSDTDGRNMILSDFASAGATGEYYYSWLPASGFKPVEFSRDNPMRVVRP